MYIKKKMFMGLITFMSFFKHVHQMSKHCYTRAKSLKVVTRNHPFWPNVL